MKYFIIACMSALIMARAGYAGAADIAVDPGHSPGKPGALSCSGKHEHQFNDNLAGKLKKYLEEKGIAVDLTRSQGEEISLMERANLSAGKKLFLSIHHDAVQPQFVEYIHGNPCSNKAEGYSIFVSSKNRHYQESLAYARSLGQNLRSFGLTPSVHHGENIAGENKTLIDANGVYIFDDLVVLKHAQSPAVLLEAAVIAHPADELRANAQVYQLAIIRAVAQTLLQSSRQ